MKHYDADNIRAVNKTADGFNPASFDNVDNRSDSDESKRSRKRDIAKAMDHTRKRLNRTAGPEADQLDEAARAYDRQNNSQAWDSRSNHSLEQYSQGNGIPAPGLPGGPGRGKNFAVGLEGKRSASQLSAENLGDIELSGFKRTGSVPDMDNLGQIPDTAPKNYRPSDLSGDQFYTNATGDRLLPTEGSMLKMDTYGPNDRELELKPKGSIQQSIERYDNLATGYDKGINMELADNDFYPDADEQDFNKMGTVNFTREDFRYMINKTFLEYYGKFKDQFNPDDYMQVVDDEEFVKRFGYRLAHNDDNLLTRYSMPHLDIGDIPTTHSFMRPESEQTYYVPHNRNPGLVYVKYSSWRPRYVSSDP